MNYTQYGSVGSEEFAILFEVYELIYMNDLFT